MLDFNRAKGLLLAKQVVGQGSACFAPISFYILHFWVDTSGYLKYNYYIKNVSKTSFFLVSK